MEQSKGGASVEYFPLPNPLPQKELEPLVKAFHGFCQQFRINIAELPFEYRAALKFMVHPAYWAVIAKNMDWLFIRFDHSDPMKLLVNGFEITKNIYQPENVVRFGLWHEYKSEGQPVTTAGTAVPGK